MAKDRCSVFCENVRSLISNPEKKENTTKVTSTNNDDMLNQLERLAKLKESGALTEDEFLLAKKKLLS